MKHLTFKRVKLIISQNKRLYVAHSVSGGRLTLALPRKRKPSKIEINLRDILFSDSFITKKRKKGKNGFQFF